MTAALQRAAEALERARALLAERRESRWCPHSPTERQAAFLARPELEALFGGAAGGGKSDALLMGALEHVDTPGYAAILFRRTYQDLAKPKALMDRAAEWLRPTAARWHDTTKTWHFPSGAQVTFGYMQTDNDRFNYQSAEFQFVGFDELTQFTEIQYRYLMSRIRRLEGVKIPLRMRGATNPGGRGHAWVAARFAIDESGRQDESSARDEDTGELRVFVPSMLSDNPHIDAAQYRKMLAKLDETTRAQLERGLWVQDSTGLVLPLEDHNVVDAPPDGVPLHHLCSMDFGSNESEETLALAVLAWSPHVPRKVWVVHTEKHVAMLLDDLAKRWRELDRRYGFGRTLGDEGALGRQFAFELRRRHGIPVMAAKKRDRMGYVRLLRDAARRGDLLLVRDGAEALRDEASALLWHENGQKMIGVRHAYDAALYGWRECMAWAAETPRPPAEEGSPAWLEAQKRKLAEQQQRQQKDWWRR